MVNIKQIFERIKSVTNLAGSRKSLELQRSIFEDNEWQDYPVLADLEHAWRDSLAGYYDREEALKTRGGSHRDAIQSFIHWIDAGAVPPPETLLLIAEALERYLAANGDLSLDEAFFGKSHKSRSSYAAAWGSQHDTMKMLTFLLGIRHMGKQKETQLETAEQVLSSMQDFDSDPESLLRAWRRWRRASQNWSD